jgi:hypothetical protein
MSITRSQIARQLYARGGNTGYSDFASPSSTTASQDFATQAVSGGQTDYGGGGDGNDQPINKVRSDFNYNIDPFSINPRLNFKNIDAIIYLQEYLDKQARGEDTDLEADINFRDQVGNLGIFGNLGRSGNLVGASMPFLQSGLASLAYSPNTGLAAGLSGNLTPNLRGGVSFQDGQQNVNFNYNKGPFSAGVASGPQGYDARFGVNYEFAKGGRINYARGGNTGYSDFASPSSTTASQDFATQAVSGGQTDYSGGGGDNQPIVARPDYVVTNTVPDNNPYGLRSKFQRGFDKALPYLAGLVGSKLGPYPGYKAYDVAKTNVEKQQEELNQFINAPITGSFYVPGQTGLPEGLIAKSDSLLGFQNRAPEPTIPTFTGGDSQPIKLPIIAEAPSDVDGTLSDFDLYMQNLRTAQPNPFMLDPRFAAAQGGVARQAYGLGSLVRKATKAVKKVLKSDIGKAALLYGAGTYLGGMKAMGGGGDLSFMDRLRNPALLKNLVYTDDKFSPFKGIAAATALTSLLSKDEEEDEDLDQISSREDKSGLREQMATYKPFRFELQSPYRLAANGGRIGYEEGGNINPADLPMSRESLPTYEDIETGEEVEYPYENKERSSAPDIDAELFQMYLDAIGSGKIPRSTTFDQYKELMGEKASMGPERTMANEGGLMNLGGNEMDLRGGGFVPLGAKEKADDVPARLSKNEFVFTADAVRAAGGGDVDRGANLMYKTMKNLESRVG